MNAGLWLAVIAGAVIGAPARFFADRRFVARYGLRFPFGTLTVNLIGSLILGLVAGYTSAVAAGGGPTLVVLAAGVGTGFCGALTTFSGFAAQVLEFEYSRTDAHAVRLAGVSYGLISLVAGVLLAAIGFAVGAVIG